MEPEWSVDSEEQGRKSSGGKVNIPALDGCPFCKDGGDVGFFLNDCGKRTVHCLKCGTNGPVVDDTTFDDDVDCKKAAILWNQRGDDI